MKKIILILALLLFPLIDFAAWTDLKVAILDARATIQTAGKLLMSLSVVIFFWGIVKFIWQDKKEEGKTHMIWGIVGLFVLFTIWGIIGFIQRSTIESETPMVLPILDIS